VLRRTGLGLTECNTDIDVIIKQMMSAVLGNVWKIENRTGLKLAECNTDIEKNKLFQLFPATIGKSSFPVTRHGQNACCVVQNVQREYIIQRDKLYRKASPSFAVDQELLSFRRLSTGLQFLAPPVADATG